MMAFDLVTYKRPKHIDLVNMVNAYTPECISKFEYLINLFGIVDITTKRFDKVNENYPTLLCCEMQSNHSHNGQNESAINGCVISLWNDKHLMQGYLHFDSDEMYLRDTACKLIISSKCTCTYQCNHSGS